MIPPNQHSIRLVSDDTRSNIQATGVMDQFGEFTVSLYHRNAHPLGQQTKGPVHFVSLVSFLSQISFTRCSTVLASMNTP